MKTLKNRYITALILAAMSGTVVMSSCGNSKKEKEAQQEEEQQQAQTEQPPVQVVSLTKGKLTSGIQIPGELIPYQQVDLYAKITSYVKKLYADVGSEVHKGQLLASLEAPEINSQLAGAKARIKQQEALYLASKANYDRLYNTSKTPGTIAQNDIDQAEARKNSDYANLEAAREYYKEISANLGYLEIRAPFDGVISARNVNLGAYVGPSGKGSDQPLFVLQEQRRLRLVISVPELNTSGLSNRNEVSFTVKAIPNEKFTAQVKRLAGALDERLRSERLEMDVYNPNKRLLPGMYAEVNLPLPSRDSTFIVPKGALVMSTEKVFVIKVVNHRAIWVDVQKGIEGGDKIEVYGKLNPGDMIITKATDEIRDGQPVKESEVQPTADNEEGQGGQSAGAGSQPNTQGKANNVQKDDGEKKIGEERVGENPAQPSTQGGGQKGSKNKGGSGASKQKQYGNGDRVGS